MSKKIIRFTSERKPQNHPKTSSDTEKTATISSLPPKKRLNEQIPKERSQTKQLRMKDNPIDLPDERPGINLLIEDIIEKASQKNPYDFEQYITMALRYGMLTEKEIGDLENFFEEKFYEKDIYFIFFLAELYFYGFSTLNIKRAKELYEMVAQVGLGAAMTRLGMMYLNGTGIRKNRKKAKEYFEMGAKAKDSTSIYFLGTLYFTGCVVSKSISKALMYFDQSASLNNPEALFMLGEIYFVGDVVPHDYVLAKRFFDRAAALGQPLAYLRLGVMYMEGFGCKKDMHQALKALSLAATCGVKEAKEGIRIAHAYLKIDRINEKMAKKKAHRKALRN